jgi:peroxiredoxin
VSPLQVGDVAPPIELVVPPEGPYGLFFFKVTCPTCRLAAPTMRTFDQVFPGRVLGIGQDPQPALDRFADEHEMGIATVEDAPPYPLSDAFAVESVPTLFLIADDRRVLECVGAWDREGFDRVAATLADLTGAEPVRVSERGDGRPDFQPG